MMSLRQSAVVLKRCFSVNTPAAAAAADPIQVIRIFRRLTNVVLISSRAFLLTKSASMETRRPSLEASLLRPARLHWKTFRMSWTRLLFHLIWKNIDLFHTILFPGCQELRRWCWCWHDRLSRPQVRWRGRRSHQRVLRLIYDNNMHC